MKTTKCIGNEKTTIKNKNNKTNKNNEKIIKRIDFNYNFDLIKFRLLLRYELVSLIYIHNNKNYSHSVNIFITKYLFKSVSLLNSSRISILKQDLNRRKYHHH